MTRQLKKFFQEGQSLKEPGPPPHQLWISGQHFPHNLEALRLNHITAVVSVGSPPFEFPPDIKHLYLQVEDHPDEDIKRTFDQAFEFIQQQRKYGGVLVHCMAGVSRSASVMAYYLMRKHRWGLEESLKCIREVRPFVRPNEGFYLQLRGAEKELGRRILLGRF